MLHHFLAALGQPDGEGFRSHDFNVDGLEMEYGAQGVNIRAPQPNRMDVRLTEKHFSRPGAYSFIEVNWNRETNETHDSIDHPREGHWLGGNQTGYFIARERNFFSGMRVGLEDGAIVEVWLDPDGETWWFDAYENNFGGTTYIEDGITYISTGPGTGTGTGTGSGDESGGWVIVIGTDALTIVEGPGAWVFNAAVYFNDGVFWANTYDLALVTGVCPEWEDIAPNTIQYVDANGEWVDLSFSGATTGQVLAKQANGTLAFVTTGSGSGTVTSVAVTNPSAGITGTVSNPTTTPNITLALANDLAALEALGSTGIAARTGTDTWAQRTLTAPSAGLAITNPAGIAGNPTFALANDLAALEALGSVGIPQRTGTDTWTQLTFDTDGTLAGNSDTAIPSQKAVKTYVDTSVTGLLDFKGNLDASANPNYPSALKGDAYYVTNAGKVGGASGKSVDVGDVVIAKADNAGGTEASVGTSWFVIEHNLVGALLASNNLSDLANATTALTNLGGAAPTGSGGIVRATSPTLVTPILGTPTSGTLSNCTGLPPASGLTGFDGLTDAEPAFADVLAGYSSGSAANRKFKVERLTGLTRLAPGGRLYGTTGVPVGNTTSSATVYYGPYTHDLICLWDGTRWVWVTFAELSTAVGSLTLGKPYDVFGFLSSGALALEVLVWTSDTARGTAATIQDGRYCKSGDKTRLLLGSFRVEGATHTVSDNDTNRGISNVYNAVHRRIFTCPAYADDNATTSYTYTSTTNGTVNGGVGASVFWMSTLASDVQAISAWNLTTPVANAGRVGLGIDSTADMRIEASLAAGLAFPAISMPYGADISPGYHSLSMLAQVGGGTMTLNADLVRTGGQSFDPYMTYLTGFVVN